MNSKMSGGKFSQGFASMGVTQAVSLSGVFDKGFFAHNGVKDSTWMAKQAIGSGVIGGFGALAAGGNRDAFMYGAVQGTMSRFLNDLQHDSKISGRGGCQIWGTNACASYNNGPRDLPEFPEAVVDAVAGFGDGVSFGATRHIRNILGVSSPAANSPVYSGWSMVGGVYNAALGSGLVLHGTTRAFTASGLLTVQGAISSAQNGAYTSVGLSVVNGAAGIVYGNTPPGRIGQALVNFQTGTSSVIVDNN